VKMPVSILLIIWKFLWLLMVFFIKHKVLIYLNKMWWLSARIDILLKQLTILICGEVSQRFWGNVVLSACYLIKCMSSSILDKKNLILIYFFMNLSIPYLLKYLDQHALFIILVLVMIIYLQGHINVSF